MTEAYLSIGSNMGDRLANLQKAIQLLNVPPKIDIMAISSVYETEPVGDVKQDSFYNIAVKVATKLTAQQLLDHLHNIEQELHRRRLIHWGPRTIDLDIIDFGHQHIKTPTLTIPHPEMANRQFVLLPMREITNIHWGPRTIDLDIIDFGHQHIKTPTLTIPHPEMANRQFVLLPMREITNQNDPYYQQLDHLLNKTPDHNWLKKIYGREVFSWTNKK